MIIWIKKYVFLVTMILILGSSCTTGTSQPRATRIFHEVSSPTTALLKTPLSPVPVSTATVVAAVTKVSTPSYLPPSSTPIEPSQTQWLPNTPTWTPLPMLSTQQSIKQVSSLLADNGGCKLPCWWGITPGYTSWSEANHFLRSFTQIEIGLRSSVVVAGKPLPYTRYKVHFNISDNNSGELVIGVSGDTVTFIQTGTQTTHLGFQLHQMLAKYGKPDLALVWTTSNAPSAHLPFMLVLYYQHLNTFALYIFDASLANNAVVSCPSSAPDPWIYLRPLENPWSLEEMKTIALGTPPPGGEAPLLRSVDEVTNLSIATFWQTFQDPETCIQTPSAYWP